MKFSDLAQHLLFPVGIFALLSCKPSFAQNAQSGGPPGNDANPLTCLARPLSDVKQVPAARRGRSFQIVAAAEYVPLFEAGGFQVVDCKGAGLGAIRSQARYRDRVCRMAASGNDAVQNQLRRALGVSPAILCANAERVAGRWDQKKGAIEADE